jgi:hypothetical protein
VVQLWITDQDNNMSTCWRSPQVATGWTIWSDFKVNKNPTGMKSIVAVPLIGGLLQLWTIDNNGRLWSCWNTAPNSTINWAPWSPFAMPPGASSVKHFAAISLYNGIPQLWAIDNNGKLWSCWRNIDPKTKADHGWTGWSTFKLPPDESGVKFFAAASLSDGSPQLWVIGNSNIAWSCWRSKNEPWTQWGLHPMPFAGVKHFAAARLSDGKLQLFAIDGNNALWTSWKATADVSAPWTPWFPWIPMPSGISLVKQITAAPLHNGVVQIWAVSENDTIWSCWKETTKSDANYTAWTGFDKPEKK